MGRNKIDYYWNCLDCYNPMFYKYGISFGEITGGTHSFSISCVCKNLISIEKTKKWFSLKLFVSVDVKAKDKIGKIDAIYDIFGGANHLCVTLYDNKFDTNLAEVLNKNLAYFYRNAKTQCSTTLKSVRELVELLDDNLI